MEASLEVLPIECLREVCSCLTSSPRDLLRFACCSRTLRSVCDEAALWRAVFEASGWRHVAWRPIDGASWKAAFLRRAAWSAPTDTVLLYPADTGAGVVSLVSMAPDRQVASRLNAKLPRLSNVAPTWCPFGKRVAVVVAEHVVLLLRATGGGELETAAAPIEFDGHIIYLQFSKCGERLMVLASDPDDNGLVAHNVLLSDFAEGGSEELQPPMVAGAPLYIDVSPMENRLAFHIDRRLFLGNFTPDGVTSHAPLRAQEADPTDAFMAPAFTPDGRFVLSCSFDLDAPCPPGHIPAGCVECWAVAAPGAPRARWTYSLPITAAGPIRSALYAVISPCGRFLAVRDAFQNLHLEDAAFLLRDAPQPVARGVAILPVPTAGYAMCWAPCSDPRLLVLHLRGTPYSWTVLGERNGWRPICYAVGGLPPVFADRNYLRYASLAGRVRIVATS